MVSGYSQQPLLKSADVARYLVLGAVMLLCGNRGKIWTTGIILKLFFLYGFGGEYMGKMASDTISKKMLIKGLSVLFCCEALDEKGTYIWHIENSNGKLTVSLTDKDLSSIIKEIKDSVLFDDDLCMYNTRMCLFEKLLQPLTDKKDVEIKSKFHNIQIKQATPAAIIAYICYIGARASETKLNGDIQLIFASNIEIKDINQLCSVVELKSVQIHKQLTPPYNSENDLSNMLLYNLAKKHHRYYIDTIRSIELRINTHDEIIQYDDIFTPYRFRKEPLQFYLQAFTFTHPMMRYLAFYHVIEFFFGNIQEQRITKTIEEALHDEEWKNDASHRKQLFKELKPFCSKLSEQDQLSLCLELFIPHSKLSELFIRINTIWPDGAAYYSEFKASFATREDTLIKEMTLDESSVSILDEKKYKEHLKKFHTEYKSIISRISKRIYKTRNYFVHSKDEEKEENTFRYVPFEDDHYINNELPLVQAIAEIFLEANVQSRNYNRLF